MTTPAPNVVRLPWQSGHREKLPVPLEHLSNAVQELQDLRDCITLAARDQSCSAKEWRVACTPLMIRLPVATQSLADLTAIRVGSWPDTPWAVRLRTAHDEVERRLADVSASARSLIQKETCTADAAVTFGIDGVKLAEALDGLCHLIKARYLATVQHRW